MPQCHDRQKLSTLRTLLNTMLSSNQSAAPAGQDAEVVDDCDEPPDHRFLAAEMLDGLSQPAEMPEYAKTRPTLPERKESLLTRALLHSPDLRPADRDARPSYPLSNASGVSTAELTSDGESTSPTTSNAPSPPHNTRVHFVPTEQPPIDPSESKVEADLGRKRCISFACKGQDDKKEQPPASETPKRKTTLMFVSCPTRDKDSQSPSTCKTRCRRVSPAPPTRRSPSPTPHAKEQPKEQPKEQTKEQTKEQNKDQTKEQPVRRKGIHVNGLGEFKPSEETRFHEFASSVDELDGWVEAPAEYKNKITVSDCMQKETVIRKLGEEAEEEAIAEEEAEDEANEEDDNNEDDEENGEEEEEDDDDDDGAGDDASTISDDGNESDNEAGFADSDDENEEESDYGFWNPSATTATSNAENTEAVRLSVPRRESNTSLESQKEQSMARTPRKKRKQRTPGARAKTPDLPDSTDFVCGTLDEDRPVEAAYISCREERRRQKHGVQPQDIDPSFPETDPEDNDLDDDDYAKSDSQEATRGRAKNSRPTSPRASPKRPMSPAPAARANGRHSPKRTKSPAPKLRLPPPQGIPVNLTAANQRPPPSRTKSLPRTPNPFFVRMERLSSISESPNTHHHSREPHTRGPIDIIQGLERKRQKRKEKFWRQQQQRRGRETQSERRRPGKGAERMKELGLEMAERFRGYQDRQFVLSV